MQLFEAHARAVHLESKLPQAKVASTDAVCRLCGEGLSGSVYPVKDIIRNTFTDIEIWRRQDSYSLCQACAAIFVDGFHKGRSEGFAAVITPTGLVSEFPWNVDERPWYQLPEGAPNVLVYPGRAYLQKHRLFRAEACQDEEYIGFWHGDIGQRFIPRTIARAVAKTESSWFNDGYPTEKEMGNMIRSLMQDGAPDLVGHTINVIKRRRKAQIGG